MSSLLCLALLSGCPMYSILSGAQILYCLAVQFTVFISSKNLKVYANNNDGIL